METVKEIDIAVINEAIDLAKNQGSLPLSPCSVETDNTIKLCAAACLAYVGLSKISRSLADSFKHSLTEGDGIKKLHQAFKVVGWSDEVCLWIRRENDRSDIKTRISDFIRNCNVIRASQA